ncbi:cyclin-A1-4 [Elaeis guineensis]|uniref:Cyclin-A1-4 n=1 Tax=Elaeis guineensis var. tenera TaxID=51953 RepID=A0A6I9QX63_ELAGV|nr:cyclin-A1-4 [Elaeis guineensis]
MSSMNRRSSAPSSSSAPASSALAKRPAVENAAKVAAAASDQAKKRVALGNITNQSNAGRSAARLPGTKGAHNGSTTSSTLNVKKGSMTCVHDTNLPRSSAAASAIVKPAATIPASAAAKPVATVSASAVVKPAATISASADVKPVATISTKDISLPVHDGPTSSVGTCLAPCSTVISPNPSGDSVSLAETMSTCDSMKSPDFEYIDNGDSSAVASLERRASDNFHISDRANAAGSTWKRDVPWAMETDDIFDVDNNHKDPQFCATLASDIYKHLRIAETKKRPSTDYMERVQKDINASMRAILIDWLVEVAEEYRLIPDTLYLTVNYIDRYLSGNEMNRQRLQLLGVACMLIAAKYEEICAPQVEEFCYITDNTYFKDEVLQMEAAVLKYLKFEMTAPTAKCFLRRFVRAAQGCDEVPLLQLEFLANYVAELSLLEYNMLCYSPSLIAASAIFLAKFILQPTKRPWNATLVHYTLYKPSELYDCAKALHRLFLNSSGSSLPAVREKYSQHKFKFVAKKNCPPSIPSEFFQHPIN